MLFRLLAWGLLAMLSWPSAGLAWTRAHVREVHARVNVVDQTAAQVQLELVIDVQGGWLERLELPLLDDDLELAEPSPALVTLESGEQLPARASVKAGVVTLKFERRDGLRRGLHRVQLRYTTDLLAHALHAPDGSLRVGWTMPGWESGLLAADIAFVVPVGAKPVEDQELAQEVTSAAQDGQQLVRFARVHVPRASQWRAGVELPGAALVAVRRASGAAATPRGSMLVGLAGAAFCLVMVLLGRLWTRRRLAQQRLAVGGWWGRRQVPGWLLTMLAVGSGLLWTLSTGGAFLGLLMLQLVSIEWSAGPAAPPALGAFQSIPRAAQRTVRWARVRELIGAPGPDFATLFGLVLLAALGLTLVQHDAFAASAPWGLLALPALPTWIFASRLRFPRSAADQLAFLLRAARAMRTVGCAMGLVWYVAGQRREQPRLRLYPRARTAGLLRLELMVDARRGASPLVLGVLVESDSPAERWTRSLWPDALIERSAVGARLAILVAVDDPSAALEQLLSHYTRESQRALAEPGEQSQAA